MHLVAGIPKIRNGTNVAASRRLDSEADISIRKELMPNAKPIAKNIMPTKARGTMKFFCEVFIIIG